MKRIWNIIFFCCITASVWANTKHILTTEELLRLAERNSQSITQAQLDVIVKQKEIDVAKARYFPVLRAEALDSAGFPGSSAWLGTEGLVGSPYRSGPTAGVVTKQLIYDFGRTAAAVKAARSQVDVAKQSTRVTAYQVQLFALQAYYQCATYKKKQEIWSKLAKESALITKEAKHFVNTGQRSVVDNYLSESETEEARTEHAFLKEQVLGSLKELAVITGKDASTIDCPILSEKLIDSLNSRSRVYASPYVKRAIADAKAAQEQLKKEKAIFRPEIVAIASGGGMDKTHLVRREDYAVGVGVSMPLLDFNITSRISQAQAELIAKQQAIAAQKQFIEEMNAKLDLTIRATITRIKHLNIELNIAKEGFKVAKRRYFNLEGDLVDLREAWRNLARAQTIIEDARNDLLQAKGAKALLNGWGY
ncbi:type I secretion outer membrane protein, TolC family [Legionella steigerwaltii]|uniref:Outer membrane efflux protein n=1 Tax=Legionella steigerwaltii TaxID=460 RepID=A0A378L7H2_9GAMM|nr:TolC family protein [Legionella steigerwaltii]KTD77477.1 Outer membrane efflux protein [Legionella steigerwaltii]STY22667.1 type I secretion outer membrane protein, TolC family [Legionella steigerwaltii]